MFAITQDSLPSAGNGSINIDGVIPGEQMPLVPVIGPSGEMMYCMPGGLNGNIQGAMTPHASHVTNAMRLGAIQRDAVRSRNQQTHLQPNVVDNYLMQHVQNGVISLSTNHNISSTTIKPVDFISSQGNFSSGCYSNFVQFQNHEKPTLMQSSTKLSAQFQNNVSETSTIASEKKTSSAFFGLPNDVFLTPRISTVPIQATHQLAHPHSQPEKQHYRSKPPNHQYNELGPVEKAIFKQALSKQSKNLAANQKNNTGKSAYTPQAISDMHFRSTKHFPVMFEQQITRVGNDGSNTGVVQSEKTSGASPAQGLPTSSQSNMDHAFAVKTSSRSNPDIASQSADIHQTATNQRTKSALVPAIRYHPYRHAEVISPTKEDCKTENDQSSSNSSTNQTIAGKTKAEVQSLSDKSPSSTKTTTSITATANHDVSKSSAKSHTLAHKRSSPFENCSHMLDHDGAEERLSNKAEALLEANSANANSPISLLFSEVSTAQHCVSTTENEMKKEIEIELPKLENKSSTDALSSETSLNMTKGSPEPDDKTSQKEMESPAPGRDINLPDPLPSYISKVDRPPGRILKESLHCTTCDVYVNSENQMKQHINSLRHKNTLQGIPLPPKPGREEKPKLRAEQYRCSVCKVTLNSDIQLSQHLASQRHKNMLEGKPPKPRWSPYERNQQALLHAAPGLRLPFKTLPTQSLLGPSHSSSPVISSSIPTMISGINTLASLPGRYVPAPNTVPAAAHLKQASFMLQDGGLVPAREIVYVGAPQLPTLAPGAAYSATLPGIPGIVANQQPLQLQHILASQPANVDWLTANGLRLAT